MSHPTEMEAEDPKPAEATATAVACDTTNVATSAATTVAPTSKEGVSNRTSNQVPTTTNDGGSFPPVESTEDGSGRTSPLDDDEDDDGEEALFASIEKEQQEEHDREAQAAQPKQVDNAPALLRQALKEGQVKADDSETEEEEEKKSTEEEKGEHLEKAAPHLPDGAASGSTPSSPVHHIHQRASQLDYLLNKASQYSSFIAHDLMELQAAMAAEAQAAAAEGPSKGKKKRGAGVTQQQQTKRAKIAGALASAEQKDAVRAGSVPIFVQPDNLSRECKLKDYQLEGVRWLASLYENGVSGILADEMGLGKTIQCVALIAHLMTKDVGGPFLIVAPLATLPNWVREFRKWMPQQPVVRYHGPASEREAMMRGPLNPKNRRQKDFPIIITSYEIAIRDQNKLGRLAEFTYLIVDEGHRLKNHRCTLISSLKKIPSANRLLLTGTPIQNSLPELWSLLHFVNPTIFDDLSVFQSWFGFKDIGQAKQGATQEEAILLEQRQNNTISKLHEILRPFLLRRIKTDVLAELPPKKEVIVYSGISNLQACYADMIEKGILRETLIAQGIEDGRTLSQTNKMMNHRKNINHPFLFGEPRDPATGVHMGTIHPQLLIRASGKFALLDRMLDRLYKDGHQVLIFSQMTKVLNVIEDYLRYRSWKYCRIDGSTQIDERQRQMDEFNAEMTGGENGSRNKSDDRIFVFLLSTRAGGLGINLTSADTCIIFDSDFNPFQDQQAMARCHRITQTLPVAVYRLLTVNSVDMEMMEKQISKKKLERMTIAGGDFRRAGSRSRGDMTFEHLSSLLQSEIDLNAKGTIDVEHVKISDEEFDMILDRKKLFSTGPDAVPTEGKMYDIIDDAKGDVLGAMDD